jgi:prepilin-type N-terminal cleavage/methylation domain-containing protein
MKKAKIPRILKSQKGMTLLEILVSCALVGIVFVALMSLIGKSGEVSAIFRGQVRTIQGVSETVAVLNALIPQVTRIQHCGCRSNDDSRANCIWESSRDWEDPVRTGGATSPVTILSGEFEAYDGTQALNSMAGLLTPTGAYQGVNCEDQVLTGTNSAQRGCRQTFQLNYVAPTQATAGTPSKAGMLRLKIGGRADQYDYKIGEDDYDGAGGLGVTELSCGFDNTTGAVTGTNFVLNVRVKTKFSNVADTSNLYYESWYPGRLPAEQTVLATKNYLRGQFREIRLKFGMRNLFTRGLYSWRAAAIRNCKANGTAAGSATECCSQAHDGTNCVACVPGGVAPTGGAGSCCSGQAGNVTAGLCD